MARSPGAIRLNVAPGSGARIVAKIAGVVGMREDLVTDAPIARIGTPDANTQSAEITIVLTGQSMIRSDLRGTRPAPAPVIERLLNGDVIFTNLEAAVAEPGETIQEGEGF
jgi:hypothetical protein